MGRILIQGGLVLSLASQDPDIIVKDVLIDGSTISQVADNIPTDGVEKLINAKGKVVMPGNSQHFVKIKQYGVSEIPRHPVFHNVLGLYNLNYVIINCVGYKIEVKQ